MDINIFAARSLKVIEAACEMCLTSRATIKLDGELIVLSRNAIARSRHRPTDQKARARHEQTSVELSTIPRTKKPGGETGFPEEQTRCNIQRDC
jgi:hypothetical protein